MAEGNSGGALAGLLMPPFPAERSQSARQLTAAWPYSLEWATQRWNVAECRRLTILVA